MMKKVILLLLLLVIAFPKLTLAQNVVISSDGTNRSPSASAMLELQSSTKGMLIPRMTAAERIAISGPSKGLLVFQNDGFEAFYYYNGTAWDTLNLTREINIVTEDTTSGIAIVSDFKSSGTNGGTFTEGSWVTRDLNHLEGDSSFISIDNITSFTLDSGIYQINANAPARQVDGHQIRLLNLSSNLVVSNGTVVRSANASPNSIINTILQIDTATTFVIQHRCEKTNTDNTAMGVGVNWGESIFTQLRIRKL